MGKGNGRSPNVVGNGRLQRFMFLEVYDRALARGVPTDRKGADLELAAPVNEVCTAAVIIIIIWAGTAQGNCPI